MSRRARTVRECLVLRVPVTPGCCSDPSRHRLTSRLGLSQFGVCYKAETYNFQETQSRFERGPQTKWTARRSFAFMTEELSKPLVRIYFLVRGNTEIPWEGIPTESDLCLKNYRRETLAGP